MNKRKHIFLKVLTLVLFCSIRVIAFGQQNQSVSSTDTTAINRARIELIYADKGLGSQQKHPDTFIFVGNVHFKHKGMHLFCDSILLFSSTNSVEAFDNVRMEQGDTLYIYGDYLYYDGQKELARLRNNIRMENITTTLTTDSLNYDRRLDLGYYFNGGILADTINVLESDWGEYSPATKVAKFKKEVQLSNNQMELYSDTLVYNTVNNIATILGPSEIVSAGNRIHTTKGYYDTTKEKSELFNRSSVYTDRKILTGDSIYYDKLKGVGEAFSNVILNDTINRNQLAGDYCFYDELSQYAFATGRALAVDYSQGDSLYIHGDTLKLNTFHLNTDSVYREIRVYDKVRIYRSDLQGVCDTLVYNSNDSCIVMRNEPVIWNETQQLLGEEIRIYMNDSTIDWAHIENQALVVEQKDSIHYNQIAGKEIKAYFNQGEIYRVDVIGNVLVGFYPEEKDKSMLGLISAETSLLNIYISQMQLQRLVMSPSSNGILYPLSQIPEDKLYLKNFVWLDYVRPRSKNDLFDWRPKKPEHQLKESTPRSSAPKVDPKSMMRNRK